VSEVEIVVSDKYVSRGGFGAAKKGVKELNSEIKDLGKTSKDTERSFASMSGSLATSSGSAGSKAASSLKDSFGKGISGVGDLLGDVFSKPNPYVYAGAAVLGTLAGGAAAGAFTTALGAGIVGIGVVAAAKTGEVRLEFQKLKQDLGSEMRTISEPFQQSLIDIANSARTQFGRIKPILADAFKDAAPTVSNFGDSVARAFARMGPAIKPLTDAFNAVLADLGPRLPGLVSRIAESFAELADSVKESPEALGDLIDVLGTFVVWVTDTVRILNEGYSAVRSFFEAIAGVDTIAGKATAASEGMNKLGSSTDTAGAAGRRYEAALSDLADAEDDTTKKGHALLAMLDIMAGRTPDYTDSLARAADSVDSLGINFKNAEDRAKGFGQTLLDQAGAFDVTNENGRELYDQVRDLETEFANMAAAVSNGQGSREQFISDTNRMRERLNETWRQAGLNAEQIDRLNYKYSLTPSQIMTSLELLGVNTAQGMIDGFIRMNNGRTISIYTSVLGSGGLASAGRLATGGISSTAHAATGGARGGDTIINEQGPENVRLPNGSTVINAGTTRRLEQQMFGNGMGMGNGPMQVVIELDGKQIAVAMIDPLKAQTRKRGGSPEVFG
jgi:ABC-type transporter Mla subunit MlaD